jgi:type I restriction enzyme, S subunit
MDSLTELELPSGWSLVRLADVVEEVAVRARDVSGGMELPILSLTKNQGLIEQRRRFSHRIAREDVSDYKVLHRGCIAYNPMVLWEGAVHALRSQEAGLVSPVYITWAVREGFDSDYVDLMLRSPFMLAEYERLASGVVKRRRTVRKDAFLRISVLVPPISEQRAAAGVLRSAERSLVLTQQVRVATDGLGNSLMRQFLAPEVAGGVSAGGDLKYSENSDRWSIHPLGELCEVKGGKRLPKGSYFSEVRTEYPYLRVVDFHRHTVSTAGLKYLNSEDHRALSRYVISHHDVYVSIAGSIGVVGRIPPELDGAHLTENAAKLIISKPDEVLADFLVAVLGSRVGQRQMHDAATRGTQPKLALARLRAVQIPVPPRDTQRRIAQAATRLGWKIRAEEAREAATRTLISALVGELMTGRRRIDIDGAM